MKTMADRKTGSGAIAQVLSVGDVSRRSGIPVSALHFYEAKGLISSLRTPGNQRRYPRDVLRRLGVIRVAQRVGIPLDDIKVALDALPKKAGPTRTDWKHLSSRWRSELDLRIAQLEKLRDTLDDCIGCGCLSIDRCTLRNPGDRFAARGPGAVRLRVPEKG